MKTLVNYILENMNKYSEDWIWETWSTYAESFFEDNFKSSELAQEFEDLADNGEKASSFYKILNIIVDEEKLNRNKVDKSIEIWIKTAKSWAVEMLS